MYKIIVPELGEGIETAVLAQWYVSKGDNVSQDAEIAEVVTDKASFCINTDISGIVEKIYAEEGTKVKIGQAIAELKTDNI